MFVTMIPQAVLEVYDPKKGRLKLCFAYPLNASLRLNYAFARPLMLISSRAVFYCESVENARENGEEFQRPDFFVILSIDGRSSTSRLDSLFRSRSIDRLGAVTGTHFK